ncbi:hypothetical protein [Desulfofundulus thermosubterraneus]|uniref:Uncharacterized protein n=1 Tax=Desulfofundulus thermosubterraneus DSM 16057 TaxID=1121432 RepID=A0A1M6C655_9FIRM|nr:hypothetical protein [Desulfofundulus thermosubterraneus]SHI56281.1 hypothetical protein SAMN02745219_00603 [Desulfofundulus thermosubterraneus DSM 16057]
MISRIPGVLTCTCTGVTTVAMIDRRPAEEQRENPFVVGEMVLVEYKMRVAGGAKTGRTLKLKRLGEAISAGYTLASGAILE